MVVKIWKQIIHLGKSFDKIIKEMIWRILVEVSGRRPGGIQEQHKFSMLNYDTQEAFPIADADEETVIIRNPYLQDLVIERKYIQHPTALASERSNKS